MPGDLLERHGIFDRLFAVGGIVIEPPCRSRRNQCDRPLELEAGKHRIIWHALLQETRMGDGRFNHIQRFTAMVCLQFGQIP